MEFTVGATYKSPHYGRNIKLVSLDATVNDSYSFTIVWIDRDTEDQESDTLTVTARDLNDWKRVG